jgi:hypothetical protein
MNFKSSARHVSRIFGAAALAACVTLPAQADRHGYGRHHGHGGRDAAIALGVGVGLGLLLNEATRDDGPRDYYDNSRFMDAQVRVCRDTGYGFDCRMATVHLDGANPGDNAAARCLRDGYMPTFMQYGNRASFRRCDYP